MSADFWMGFSSGIAFVVVVLSAFVALSKRLSAEQRKAHETTISLLEEANYNRDRIATELARVANELEQQGGRK
jgi:hypothetical protein